MTRTHTAHGFTLIEVLITLSVALIILGTAVWSMGDILPGYRTNAAARKFAMDARNALALAARANEPVHLVRIADTTDCQQAYRIIQGANPASPTRELERVCLSTEYTGVSMDAAGIAAPVQCADDLPATSLDTCSFCAVGARLTFYPTGEVVAVSSAGGVQGSGHSVVFSPTRGADRQQKALAVGVRSGTGRARVYGFDPAQTLKWVCK
jgi:prepilin-type N-terminal cleavage/methylation domain-containing protein